MQTFKKLLFLLTPHERKRAGLLLIMLLIMSLLDMTGVASILPFMAVLTNPSLIETNFILNYIFEFSYIFGVQNNQQFIFALGVLVFLVLVISLLFKALTYYAQARFVYMREYTIGKRLIEGYLNQPYSWFLSRHSADLGKTVLSEVQQLILDGMRPLLELISNSMITIAIITLLFIVDTKLTLVVGCSIFGAYIIIFYSVSKFLSLSGSKRLINNQLRFTTVNEAFGAAKEVKIGGLEKSFINRFSKSAQIYAQTHASRMVISALPRYVLEAIAFGGVLLMILYIMSKTGSFNSALPIVSLYVFAGYRLMPAVQKIYESFTQLTFIGPSLNKLYDDIQNLKEFDKNQDQDILPFNKSITLKNIHYNYPNTSREILKDISLSISAKSTVGIVGVTGSGKTTMVDIILGLLEPQKGTLKIDGKIITKQNVRSWQRSIGYVPQQIFIADDTIASNIAFGLETKDINKEAVEKAAKIANLHEFVINELPKKYETTVGERGIRLSGGQRQRIGIARALYHNPQLLILDEATSALDNQTEKAVMDAINNLGKNITIILIAHRLNTIKKCDKNFLIEKSEIKKELTYEELINVNKDIEKNANN
jgi:ABC-type multidrug transport system fused ATPase/permease subunit